MKIKELHSWDVSPEEAVAIQKDLRNQVKLAPLTAMPETVAGVDVSYDRGCDIFYAAVIVFTYPELEVIEKVSARDRVSFPYVPGLLSFREGPVVLQAFGKLKNAPDVVIFDGQGIAHPRGLGIASHIGLVSGIPAVGCAKSRLCGDYIEPGMGKGENSPLILGGKEVGMVLRTRRGIKPVFVSPGYLMDIPGSYQVVLGCCTKYRLPEPTREAHLLVNKIRIEAT